ncbi:MAG: PEP-CTERM sorting domain-containing protein [Erythrobacter sp.]|nr:PEP-CTERM sorting domain-containing protein [Erythrobacter sp.]
MKTTYTRTAALASAASMILSATVLALYPAEPVVDTLRQIDGLSGFLDRSPGERSNALLALKKGSTAGSTARIGEPRQRALGKIFDGPRDLALLDDKAGPLFQQARPGSLVPLSEIGDIPDPVSGTPIPDGIGGGELGEGVGMPGFIAPINPINGGGVGGGAGPGQPNDEEIEPPGEDLTADEDPVTGDDPATDRDTGGNAGGEPPVNDVPRLDDAPNSPGDPTFDDGPIFDDDPLIPDDPVVVDDPIFNDNPDNPAGPVGAVPEPGTWLLLLLGMAMTGAALRHDRAAKRDARSSPGRRIAS